jgi:hypothetical protein
MSIERAPLPVIGTIRLTLSYIRDHRRFLALPLVLLFFCNLAEAFLAPPLIPPLAFILSMLNWFISAGFLVGVHRAVLLDEARQGLQFFRLNRLARCYMVTGFLLTFLLIPGGFGMAAGIEGIIKSTDDLLLLPELVFCIGALGLLVGAWLILRWSLALPGAALDQDARFRVSWASTSGNAWRIFWLEALLQIPTIAIGAILVGVHGEHNLVITGIVKSLQVIVDSCETLLYAVSLSYAFGWLVRGDR